MIDAFRSAILAKADIRFRDIIRFAGQFVPEEYYGPDAWRYFHREGYSDDRGRRPITEDEAIMCYLVAYGQMHQSKLKIAFDAMFGKVAVPSRINIVDWGCGQGLGTMVLLDYLKEKGRDCHVDNVILVEPSALALEYAELYVSKKLSSYGTKIKIVNKFFSDLKEEDLQMDGDSAVIHLYSNILDVEGIDIKDLALWLRSFRQRENYVVCASPYYWSGNNRIEDFFNYLNNPVKIAKAEESDKQNNPDGNFTYNIRIVKLLAEAASRIRNLRFYTPRQFFGAYRIDSFKDVDVKRYAMHSAFDVYAPYEISSSYKDDVDPVYAVLSNMISRGLPTKASPFIEEELSKAYGNSERKLKYGTISFPSCMEEEKLRICESVLDSHDYTSELAPLVMTPVAVARIQKTIVEALITGKLSVDDASWKVVVEEADVPCAALALEDLRQMFTNLVSLSQDYSERVFPDIDLTVVNSHFTDSPLHLGARVVKSHEDVSAEDFDLAIDYTSSTCPPEEYVFSKYNVKQDKCYFAVFAASEIRSQRYIYTTDLITYRALTSTDETGQYAENITNTGYLEYFLQVLFRKEQFRMGQLPILNRALRNRSVIGLLPTGGGKSLTYQLAAMLQPGVAIVIDPLRSLMQDQYDGLIANGIDCCTFINSSVDRYERSNREYMIEQSQCLFAFMSPERLCIYSFRKRLQNMHESNVYFSYGVIDEVHCVSEWGQDFRFTYLHLGRNLYNYVRSKTGVVTLFGLTATASFDVLADVERELSGNGAYDLDSEVLVRCEDTNRLELQYRIIPVPVEFSSAENYYDKDHTIAPGLPKPYNITSFRNSTFTKSDALAQVIDEIPSMERELMETSSINHIVKKFYDRQNRLVEPGAGKGLKTEMPDGFCAQKETYDQAGIVFCPHKGKTEVSVDVSAEKLRTTIPDVGIFYSSDNDEGDTENLPMKNMIAFRDNKLSIMVATKAFGMGIDKPNVRFTVNMNYSNSLEAYVQEAGRAGRDRAMALSIILVSDYDLVRVNSSCRKVPYELRAIKGQWFKEEDLQEILDYYGIDLNWEEDCTRCNPSVDLVKLECEKNQEAFKKFSFSTKTCGSSCPNSGRCGLERLKDRFAGWGTYNDLMDEANQLGIRLVGRNIIYQSPDYQNMMYFYSKGYPGTIEEKRVMHELMSNLVVSSFVGDNMEINTQALSTKKGFLDLVLSKNVGEEVVSIISYENLDDAAFSKAIYRMCCIGFIDDFTRDYAKKTYRVVCIRKPEGGYYECLKSFLMRYYPEAKATAEVEKAKEMKGQNEVQKCLAYLTEFIYEKLAVKKKRAIDDIRSFCNIGLNKSKDWKKVNEDLKDYIYYYFNSKFAKEDYVADNDEPYSLTVDTDYGKEAPLEMVDKYIKVVEDEICGSSGNPIDNIKHLQGAVRLILRSLTRENPVIELLNVFCILFLKEYKTNESIRQTLEESYANAYRVLWDEYEDKKEFYTFFENYKKNIFSHGADKKYKEQLEMIEVNAETTRYRDFISKLGWDR